MAEVEIDSRLPDSSTWRMATPETIEALFDAALARVALDFMQHDDPQIRMLAARDWPEVVNAIRQRWEQAAEKAIAEAQSDLARQEGRLQ